MSVDYAAPHQTGTKFMVSRMMVPSKARGLPKAWREAYAEIATNHLAAHLGSKKAARIIKANGGIGFVKGRLTGLKRRFNLQALLRKAMRAVSGD